MKNISLFLVCLCLVLVTGHEKSNENDKEDKKTIQKRAVTTQKRSSTKAKQSTVDDLALQLAKLHLMQLIAEKESKIHRVQAEVKELEQDRCGVLSSVGDPVAHHTTYYAYGAWMRDPISKLGKGKIWLAEYYYNTKTLYEYDSMEDLKANIKSKSYTTSYYRDGTGSVVYGGKYYYNKENSYYIYVFDLKSGSYYTNGYPSTSLSPRSYNYPWGGYNYMDLSVDESGLWAIYSISNAVYVTKMQTQNGFTATKTWKLSGAGSFTSIGNAFIACGVFYAIDSYTGYSTTINYAYDFATGREWNPNIKFRNFMSYTTSLSYNPAEKKLYAWSSHHLVTYPLEFSARP